MPYPFLGSTARIYGQYLDTSANATLTAHPGGSYEMTPAGNWDLPVPPGDGLWGPDPNVPAEPAAPEDPGPVPPPLMTASTEDEGQ